MATKKKTAKRKLSKAIASNQLLSAVGRWVEAYGGRALVAGGISVETWPEDPHYCFYVRVRVTGKKPIELGGPTDDTTEG